MDFLLFNVSSAKVESVKGFVGELALLCLTDYQAGLNSLS